MDTSKNNHRGKETDKSPEKQRSEAKAQSPKTRNARGDTASERPDRGTT